MSTSNPIDQLAAKNRAVAEARCAEEMQQRGSFYYPLFEHLSREHGLTLLDSELAEIVRICARLNIAVSQPGTKP